MSDDDHITLEKLLEKDEQILLKLPAPKGPFEIFCLLFACCLVAVGLNIFRGGVFPTLDTLHKIWQPMDIEVLLGFVVVPIMYFCVFNSKMVITNKKIIKYRFFWATVEVKSWADVEKISAKNDVLIIDLKEAGKTLSFKTKEAVRLKAECSPLLDNAIEDKESTT